MSWWEVQDKPQPAGGVPVQGAMEVGAMESVEMFGGLLVVAGTMEEAERADVVAVEAVDRVTLRDLRYLTTLQAKQGTALSRLLLHPAARVMCSPVGHVKAHRRHSLIRVVNKPTLFL